MAEKIKYGMPDIEWHFGVRVKGQIKGGLMKKLEVMIVTALIAVFVLACGSKDGTEKSKVETIESTAEDEGSTAEENSTETSSEADEDSELAAAAIGTYKPSEVYDFCKDQSLYDAHMNCTVNQNSDYAEKNIVDLGDVFPDKYRDIDLDGDGMTDSISRIIENDGCIYKFEFGNGTSFTSGSYSMVPNEGEIISFYDFDNDNIDEILITHITESTGGPVVWNCEYFSWNGDGWDSQYAVDEEGHACLAGVGEVLSGEVERYMVRDIEFTDEGIMYLVDYGMKDGANIILDLETIQVKFSGKEMYMEERSDKDSRDELTNKIWPLGI